MTERLFETDSHLKLFTAKVVSCEKNKDLYMVSLDRTAFFPEGGGQKGDNGYILKGEKNEEDFFTFSSQNGIEATQDNGKEQNGCCEQAENMADLCKNQPWKYAKTPACCVIYVCDTQEKNGEIYHYCTEALEIGETVTCLLDYETRFRRMQNHTGEHIVSGVIHKYFGFDNVGFHMGSEDVTLDINGVITKEELLFIENMANRAVAENVPVYAEVFSGDELLNLDYRSKLDITENVRIVTVDGFDKCACCAPHVSKTGEIGIIKTVGMMNYKQGVRIHMLCGFDALADYEAKQEQLYRACALISAKPNGLVLGVERLLEENKKEKQESNALKNKIAQLMLDSAEKTGNRCLFTDINDPVFLRYLATSGSELFGLCGAFCKVGDSNYRYVAVGSNRDMRQFAKEMNSALNGRGGGDSELVQGSVNATDVQIEEFFNK